MASQIEICNQALIKVGSSPIVSLSDGTKGADTLSQIWASKRDAEMAAHPWTFALARASLPASSSAPEFGFARAFPLPTGFLSLVEVGERYVMYIPPGAGDVWFQIEGGSILTDEGSPLRIRYTRRIENTGLWSPLFNDVLACRLALELCEPLSAESSKKDRIEREYGRALSTARRANAIEQPPRQPPHSTWWLAARS